MAGAAPELDYRTAFELAPIGLVLSRHRLMVDCNRQALEMFGTTRDAFQLLFDAKKYGARVALFGRKINNSECQLAFVEFLRLIADGHLEPAEAVAAQAWA